MSSSRLLAEDFNEGEIQNINNLHSPESSEGFISKILSYFRPASAQQPLLDLASSEDEASSPEQQEQIRKLELELKQSEQKLSAVIISKQKLEQECEREKSLRQQAEDQLSQLRRNSANLQKSTMSENEVERLKQTLNRAERKLSTLQKYSETIEGQLKAKLQSAKPDTSELEKLQAELNAEKGVKDQLIAQVEEKKRSSASTSTSGSADPAKLAKLAELEKTLKELNDEIAFRDSLGSKIEDQRASSVVTGGIRRGRIGSQAPNPSAQSPSSPSPSASPSTAAPPIPLRSGSISDRLKSFQNS